MALWATLGFQEGCSPLSLVGRNAYDSMAQSNILSAFARVEPYPVGYSNNLYARSLPSLLHHIVDGSIQVIHSSRLVPQGRSLGPLCYYAGGFETLQLFKEAPLVPGAQAMVSMDDIVIILTWKKF